VPALDGLRGVAALAVLSFHAWPAIAPAGYIGVDVFFVLSGYLITRILLAEHADFGAIDLRAFWVRRGLRLLPALALLLAFVACYVMIAAPPNVAGQTTLGMLSSVFYYTDFVSVANGAVGIVGHTWSLAVEEQFYLVWPLVIVVALRLKGARGVLVVACIGAVLSFAMQVSLAAHGAASRRLLYAPDTNAEALLVGCAVAAAASLGWVERMRAEALRWGAYAGVAVLAVTYATAPGIETVAPFTLTVVALATAGLILGITSQRLPVRRVLASPPMVALGRMSYAIYLWHYPVFLLLADALRGWPAPVLWAATLTITLIAARVSDVFVERPCLRLKDRFAANRERRLADGSPAHRHPQSGVSVDTTLASVAVPVHAADVA
jgi:peptidoglycan/LPS O-acetylase OafA/YrhL